MSKRRIWPIFLIAASAAVAVWSGWVGLGAMAGFGVIHLLPGIWDSLTINTAITLPIGVEAYGIYAMGSWMSPKTPKHARRFAKFSAIGSLVLGMCGQAAYHLMNAAHMTHAPFEITTVVAMLPVITLGFAAALYHLLHREEETSVPEFRTDLMNEPESPSEASPVAAQVITPAPSPTPVLDPVKPVEPSWAPASTKPSLDVRTTGTFPAIQ